MHFYFALLVHFTFALNNKVLDFAAGSCWLSKILVELGCEVISCDASEVALNIGKKLFENFPPIRKNYKNPIFDIFNGEYFKYKDKTFDRIIVNDAFHHIPNTRDILKEFNRILKDDGYVVMSEPGRYHSTSIASQYEMRNFNVIENDFILEDIWEEALEIGFKSIEILPIVRNTTMDINEYLECISGKTSNKILNNISNNTINHSIFKLSKNTVVNKNEEAFKFKTYLSQVHNYFKFKIDKNKKYILYGAGTGANLILSLFHENILYIIDNNILLNGTHLYGKEVKYLGNIKELNNDIIVSAFGYSDKIINDLSEKFNLSSDRFISLDF